MRKRSQYLQALVDRANSMIAHSTAEKEGRVALFTLASAMLMEANQYRGFRYLTYSEVPDGHAAGIIRGVDADGNLDNTRNQYPDTSRVALY